MPFRAATETFFHDTNDGTRCVAEGETFDASHPIVKKYPGLFGPADNSGGRDSALPGVEDASASKRTVRKPRKAPAK